MRLNATMVIAALALFAATQGPAFAASSSDLAMAVAFSDLDAARAALDAGADANAVNDHGDTMLQEAASKSPEMVKLLLDHHANVDARDSSGGTALLQCALYASTGFYDATAVAEVLIAAGADVNARTKDGLTPLGAADASDGANLQPLKDLLRAHGATE
jgi:ankyrin repeat protein